MVGTLGWQVHFPCVRLWQQDASAAVASGRPGLMALAPLMAGATPTLVEQAAQRLITDVAAPIQAELLAALGIFAEPLVDAERFIRLVTKERLMSSDLIAVLTADLAQEKDVLLQERAVLTEQLQIRDIQMQTQIVQLQQRLQQIVEDVLIVRFPTVPAIVTRKVREVRDPDRLTTLHHAALTAPDLTAVEQAIQRAQAA